MSTIIVDQHGTESSVNTDPLIPTSSSGQRLRWSENDAHIPGLLDEIGQHCQRAGIFSAWIDNHAVLLSNGSIAVDSAVNIPFVLGLLDDPRSFEDLCPDSAIRRAEYDARRTSEGKSTFADGLKAIGSISDADRATVRVAPAVCKQEDGRFLRMLLHVFGGLEASVDLVKAAAGSGNRLVALLKEKAASASDEDRACVSAEHVVLVRNGVVGELQMTPLNAFLEAYETSKINLDKGSKPKPPEEVQMINLIAFKSPEVRTEYRLQCAAKPPTTLAEAVKILKSILMTSVRFEQLDSLASGAAPATALAATRAAPSPPPVQAPVASESQPLDRAAIVALLAQLGVVDPSKLGITNPGGKKPGGQKVEVPRGPDGKALQWVEGFHRRCKCGVNGGKHLFRDCPKKAEREKKAKEEKAKKEQAAAAAAGSADVDSILAGLSAANKADIMAKLAAFAGGGAAGVTEGTDE